MKPDITDRKDIEVLIDHFYAKVKVDPVIGYIFTDVMKVDWPMHLPRIYAFWENAILFTGSYNGNLMAIHKHIHQIIPLSAEHFKSWTTLFCTTVDELFEGEKAVLAKQRALSISTVMQVKIINDTNAGLI